MYGLQQRDFRVKMRAFIKPATLPVAEYTGGGWRPRLLNLLLLIFI